MALYALLARKELILNKMDLNVLMDHVMKLTAMKLRHLNAFLPKLLVANTARSLTLYFNAFIALIH